MRTLVAMLQLVRAPLLPTALADAAVAVLILHGGLTWETLGPVWLAACGLYIFGMAGNDVFDWQRDRQALQAGHKGRINPIAAGVLSPRAGIVVTAFGAALAGAAAMAFPAAVNPWATLTGLGAAMAYNARAKAFPPVGLVLLGVVRAANASQGIVDPAAAIWAVPAIIGGHVIFVSTFAYAWERKRPPLWGRNWFYLLAILAGILAVLGVARQHGWVRFWPAEGSLTTAGIAWLAFLAAFALIFDHVARPARGPTLVLVGLLWLIVLDWAMVRSAGVWGMEAFFGLLLAATLLARTMLRALSRPAPPAVARGRPRKGRRR